MGELSTVLANLATVFLLWRQNKLFERQNDIFAIQAGLARPQMPSRHSPHSWWKEYWPFVVWMLVASLTALAVFGYGYYQRHSSSVSLWRFSPLLVGLVGFALISIYWKVRARAKAPQIGDPTRQESPIAPASSGGSERIPIWNAVHRVADSIHESREDGDAFPKSRDGLRQAAIDGKITIWGKKQLTLGSASPMFDTCVTAIPQEYWKLHKITGIASEPPINPIYPFTISVDGVPTLTYADLHVDQSQINEIWSPSVNRHDRTVSQITLKSPLAPSELRSAVFSLAGELIGFLEQCGYTLEPPPVDLSKRVWDSLPQPDQELRDQFHVRFHSRLSDAMADIAHYGLMNELVDGHPIRTLLQRKVEDGDDLRAVIAGLRGSGKVLNQRYVIEQADLVHREGKHVVVPSSAVREHLGSQRSLIREWAADEEKRRVKSSDWQQLADRFTNGPQHLMAIWTQSAAGESWEVGGWTGAADFDALARLAGASLLQSRNVRATLSNMVLATVDDRDRWLNFLKETEAARLHNKVDISETLDNGTKSPVRHYVFHEIGHISSSACIKCAALEV